LRVAALRPHASRGEFQHIRWYSRALQRRTEFLLHLPSQDLKQPARNYPVLYLLHGSGHNPRSVLEQVRPQEQLAELGAALLVIPNGDQGWWLDSPLQRRCNYGQYALELVALVDERYPTLASRAGRGLCGFSMGGYGAMLLASQHAEVFGAASSLLGPLDIAQMFPDYHRLRLLLGSDLEVWQRFNPTQLAARLVQTALYFCTAQEAFERPQNEAFAAALRALGIPFEHAVHAGTHDAAWVRAHLRDAWRFHRAAFDRAFHCGYNPAARDPDAQGSAQE